MDKSAPSLQTIGCILLHREGSPQKSPSRLKADQETQDRLKHASHLFEKKICTSGKLVSQSDPQRLRLQTVRDFVEPTIHGYLGAYDLTYVSRLVKCRRRQILHCFMYNPADSPHRFSKLRIRRDIWQGWSCVGCVLKSTPNVSRTPILIPEAA